MKTSPSALFGSAFAAAFLLASEPALHAQKSKASDAEAPPVFRAPPEAPARPTQPPTATFNYNQVELPPAPPLVKPEQAETIIARFREAYPRMGKPRFVIYVNRNLIDDAGMKLIARREFTYNKSESSTSANGESAGQRLRTLAENRYRRDAAPNAPLTDRQTVRDIEQLFGRPLRTASAVLVDQKIATDMIDSGKFESLTLEGEQARKGRAALTNHADVAIEILVASKQVRMASFNGETAYAVPDIQATAIRLSDARILGQASTADLTGGEPTPAFARSYSVRAVTEATALALMEDMATGFAPAEPSQ